mmetsp:Transcript_21111/g.57701  ORF Transcript_21111/g.57701 Transcript_21111/m.57701 type:complete len:260 (+) Transcript_21111:1112-1891(+)
MRIQQQGGTAPVPDPPQASDVDTALRGCRHHIRLEFVHLRPDLVQVLHHREVWQLGVGHVVAPTDLVACLHEAGALARVQLESEAWADDEDPSGRAVDHGVRPRLRVRHLAVVPRKVGEVEALLATSYLVEDACHGVENDLVTQGAVAVHVRQHEVCNLVVVSHSIDELQLGDGAAAVGVHDAEYVPLVADERLAARLSEVLDELRVLNAWLPAGNRVEHCVDLVKASLVAHQAAAVGARQDAPGDHLIALHRTDQLQL